MTAERMLQFDMQAAGFEPTLQVVSVDAIPAPPDPGAPGNLLVGVDRSGFGSAVGAAAFDVLLTIGQPPSRAWVAVPPAELDAVLARLSDAFRAQPIAAGVLAQVLRIGAALPLDEALLVESLAFSTLLGGSGFRQWLNARRAFDAPLATRPDARPRVRCARDGDTLALHLANPARRNAFDARMRDELVEALASACDDPTLQALELHGDGPDFSAGGDLHEFGSAPDPAMAHAVRTLRSPARLLARLAGRSTAFLHGACVGAGIEVPAAAARLVATPDTRLWLPELGMGLIPGAGGTATITRRIGRHRLLYWALAGLPLDATTALDWGLVDDVRSVP